MFYICRDNPNYIFSGRQVEELELRLPVFFSAGFEIDMKNIYFFTLLNHILFVFEFCITNTYKLISASE